MRAQEKKTAKRFSITLILLLVIFVASLLLFMRIADENILEKEDAFDLRIAQYFSGHSTPQLLQVMKLISFFGTTQFLLPAYILFICFLLWKREKLFAIDTAIIGVSSTAAMFLLKEIFKRDRPSEPSTMVIVNYSFPSGHTVTSFIFFSILVYYISKLNWSKQWKIVFASSLLLFSLLIGFSRLVLNVHYFTDIVAGFCMGVVWVILSFFILERIHAKI